MNADSLKDKTAREILPWLAWACLIAILGCETGVIDNFEGIKVETTFRPDRIDFDIFLLNENGRPLIQTGSILTPGTGPRSLSESKFTAHVEIYSMRNDARSKKVYDGRPIDLRWGALGGNRRVLFAEIPHRLIEEDEQRDTRRGVIIVTLQTDKQGPFKDTLGKAQIYSRVP
ncbi:hypothetical protein J4G02_00600 [Candidatus Poribacteria bacterium]|nr:hypothetical protein [Candidatus Poribacteria bacterium]